MCVLGVAVVSLVNNGLTVCSQTLVQDTNHLMLKLNMNIYAAIEKTVM